MVLRVRGFALPDGEPVDLYADGDRWTTGPVRGAELVAEGWLLPGLVDAHTHPGTTEARPPMDESCFANSCASKAPADAVVFETDPRTDLSVWTGRER